MALNRTCIGKRYPAAETAVSREAMEQYARAYDDDNPFYFDDRKAGAIIAPPMFGVVPIWKSILQVVADPEVGADILRLVHSEHDVDFLSPIRPGDVITSAAKILSIESRPTGETMAIEIPASNQGGELVQKTLFTVFIRARGRGRSEIEAREQEPERGQPIAVVSNQIAQDQTVRYAQASGDFNPIHLDAKVAAMAGLPGIVVHGLCTMAFCSKVIVGSACEGDPRRLGRLRVRFVRPVLPGQNITTTVWASGEGGGRRRYDFETVNPERRPIIGGGLAEVTI